MDHARRLAEFRARFERERLDAYWLVKPQNVRYLSGFTGEDSTLLVTGSRSVLVTDSRYEEQAEREACADEVVSRHVPMTHAVGTLCKGLGVAKVAVTAANLTHADYVGLAAACESARVVSRKEGLAEKMRMRKDADEVAAIRAAVRLAEEAFGAVLGEVQPGRAERWLAARLEFEMRARGAEAASFEPVCAAGAHASMPHAVSGEAPLPAEGPLLVDWGARLGGYCSDLTRMVCVGRIPRQLQALVDVVLAAQEAVLRHLRPGARCGDADAAGRAVIARSGYGARFGHGMGHGVGLAVHESPRLGPRAETVLLPGMVVTVEPGIYMPGQIGVRIEEDVLITPDGHEVLSTLPRRPHQVGG
jgi:Xaa-Pro aminopeptidase